MYKDASIVISELEKEAERFYQKLSSEHFADELFALPDDVPLTDDEIRQVDEFWGRYRFAYPQIDYKSFATFKNRCGYFDVHHCPGMIRRHYLNKYFLDSNYQKPFTNKGMLGVLFPDIPQPRTIIRQLSKLYYNEKYECISYEQMLQIICEHLTKEDGLIVKINESFGGKGVFLLKKEDASYEALNSFFEQKIKNKAFVIQSLVKQSAFMNRLNESSVNTIRITTLLYQGKFRCLAALLRVGGMGSFVDNWSSGGTFLGVDIETGRCYPWAMGGDRRNITILQSGVDLEKENLVIPNFDKVKETVLRAHAWCPFIKMISWDIALDQNNMPVMIENNHAGMMQAHEALTGPLFGDLMKDLCDEYLLEKHNMKFATQEFICKEYNDHVTIVEYIGNAEIVKIPAELKGKPVTLVEKKAFDGCPVKEVIAQSVLFENSAGVFNKIEVHTAAD